MTLPEKVLAKLKERRLTVAFAESCTGGRAVAALVDVPDASCVLGGSYVTYSNEAKTRLLGVSQATLEAFGAVSEQTAAEMARGVRLAEHSDVGVSVTGIAGPGGGTPEKPVGTVCFGFCVGDKTVTRTEHFDHLGRSAVRDAAVAYVYKTLDEIL